LTLGAGGGHDGAMDERAAIREGLNVFRALEAWGAKLYAAWAENEPDERLRAGHLIIAEREATHARLLAERIRALGGEPGPACVDDVLAAQLAELRDVVGFVAQLDGLKRCSIRDAARMAPCQEALRQGFDAAKAVDPETHRFWAELYSEERVSGGWYRATYSALTKGAPHPVPLPLLDPGQVVRRAERVTFTAGEPAACAAVV
jgi:rubrerythrin